MQYILLNRYEFELVFCQIKSFTALNLCKKLLYKATCTKKTVQIGWPSIRRFVGGIQKLQLQISLTVRTWMVNTLQMVSWLKVVFYFCALKKACWSSQFDIYF